MTGGALTQLLQAFIMLSVFLLIGTFLRALVPAFQKTFLPAAVIGGFLALFVGPRVWPGGGLLGALVPEELLANWLTTWGALPGVLIVPVVASVPLGLKMGVKKAKGEGGSTPSARKTSMNVVMMLAIGLGMYFLQIVVGAVTNGLFATSHDLYATFGYELAMGFTGGHGTAGVVGNFLYGRDLPFAQLAQGVTVATATFGIVGGMVLGILYINIMARKGQTKVIKKPADMPKDLAAGIVRNPADQKSAGKETTVNSSIESMTFHLAIILLVCGIAYVSMGWVQRSPLEFMHGIPVWTYAILGMFLVNYLINIAGLHSLIDGKTKSRATGVLTDYAIIAAIASMPVRTVIEYLVPIMVMVVVGFTLTYFVVMVLCKKIFGDDYHVERAVGIWGAGTGVFITGVMLMKICDPEFESPALADYSLSFAIHSTVVFLVMPFVFDFFIYQGPWVTAAITGGLAIASYVAMFIAYKAKGNQGA